MPIIATTTVVEWNDGLQRSVLDDLAGEAPLEIRVGEEPVGLTMRTPGHDRELAAGYVLTEGLVARASDILRVGGGPSHAGSEDADAPDGSSGIVRVEVAASCDIGHRPGRRQLSAISACGVCGRASLEGVREAGLSRPAHTLNVAPSELCGWAGRVRSAQRVFSRTGGLHAAALFGEGPEPLVIREDIGRHNAVDKVIGWALLDGRLPLSGCGLFVSGRGGFEIIQKAVAAGIELVACVSAPSSLAVQLAREFGLTLVGFLRNPRFIVYAGPERLAGLRDAAGA